ncbi:hypothetical protein B0A49_02054 [Cryomyces minteri]|uniref:Uncharacterized protein n=1 Tax=Cryomyces minteri TaxID=331657 RepID=A0A4U0XRR0_9PEZI|nr:hypothetical protein B0A49_02054 [Cryomyces minteri]
MAMGRRNWYLMQREREKKKETQRRPPVKPVTPQTITGWEVHTAEGIYAPRATPSISVLGHDKPEQGESRRLTLPLQTPDDFGACLIQSVSRDAPQGLPSGLNVSTLPVGGIVDLDESGESTEDVFTRMSSQFCEFERLLDVGQKLCASIEQTVLVPNTSVNGAEFLQHGGSELANDHHGLIPPYHSVDNPLRDLESILRATDREIELLDLWSACHGDVESQLGPLQVSQDRRQVHFTKEDGTSGRNSEGSHFTQRNGSSFSEPATSPATPIVQGSLIPHFPRSQTNPFPSSSCANAIPESSTLINPFPSSSFENAVPGSEANSSLHVSSSQAKNGTAEDIATMASFDMTFDAGAMNFDQGMTGSTLTQSFMNNDSNYPSTVDCNIFSSDAMADIDAYLDRPKLGAMSSTPQQETGTTSAGAINFDFDFDVTNPSDLLPLEANANFNGNEMDFNGSAVNFNGNNISPSGYVQPQANMQDQCTAAFTAGQNSTRRIVDEKDKHIARQAAHLQAILKQQSHMGAQNRHVLSEIKKRHAVAAQLGGAMQLVQKVAADRDAARAEAQRWAAETKRHKAEAQMWEAECGRLAAQPNRRDAEAAQRIDSLFGDE